MKCQQFELYAAESGVPTGRQFATAAEMQTWVDSLRETTWWERNFPQVLRVEVYFRPRGACSVGSWHPDAGAGIVEMLPCHRNELVGLHEVCHVLAAARFGSHAHDPWFARIYLEAVYTFMGSEVYAQLRSSFDLGGIDHDTDNLNPAGIVVN